MPLNNLTIPTAGQIDLHTETILTQQSPTGVRRNVVPFADTFDDSDVGEEMVVLGGSYGLPQCLAPFEVPHQDAKAVEVREL